MDDPPSLSKRPGCSRCAGSGPGLDPGLEGSSRTQASGGPTRPDTGPPPTPRTSAFTCPVSSSGSLVRGNWESSSPSVPGPDEVGFTVGSRRAGSHAFPGPLVPAVHGSHASPGPLVPVAHSYCTHWLCPSTSVLCVSPSHRESVVSDSARLDTGSLSFPDSARFDTGSF